MHSQPDSWKATKLLSAFALTGLLSTQLVWACDEGEAMTCEILLPLQQGVWPPWMEKLSFIGLEAFVVLLSDRKHSCCNGKGF